jgi:hypothetical protein
VGVAVGISAEQASPGAPVTVIKAMRGVFGAALGLLVVAGTAFTGRSLDAHAVGGLNTVTVSPTHGKVTASFQVTYAISPCTNAAGLTIGFSWGALAPAGPVLGTATTDSACRATLTTTPPAKPAPGTYQVFGYVALPTGAPTPDTEASASYKVDVTPTPTATSSASASASASATTSASATGTARATGTANPSASAPGGTVASPSASGASTSDQPVTFATPQSTGLARSGSQQPWWTLEWTVGRVGVIALFILILIAFLAAWLIRRRRAHAAASTPGKDKAA